MAKLFELKVDLTELDKYAQFYRVKGPRQVRGIIRSVLNDQAFAVMKKARNHVLPSMFNIRNKWVQSSIVVDKVPNTIKKSNQMVSIVGGAKKWSRNRGKPFIGLRYQQFGKIKHAPSIDTSFSRGGRFSGKVKSSLRYNRLGKIEKSNKYKGTTESATTAMLRDLSRKNYKGTFLIRRHSSIRTGVYKFARGRKKSTKGGTIKNIRMVKDLSHKRVKIPNRPWLTTSTAQALNKGVVIRMTRRATDRKLTPRGRA